MSESFKHKHQNLYARVQTDGIRGWGLEERQKESISQLDYRFGIVLESHVVEWKTTTRRRWWQKRWWRISFNWIYQRFSTHKHISYPHKPIINSSIYGQTFSDVPWRNRRPTETHIWPPDYINNYNYYQSVAATHHPRSNTTSWNQHPHAFLIIFIESIIRKDISGCSCITQHTLSAESGIRMVHEDDMNVCKPVKCLAPV